METSSISTESLRSHAPAASFWTRIRLRIQALASRPRESAGGAAVKGRGILILPRTPPKAAHIR